jgi:hypothetical protein
MTRRSIIAILLLVATAACSASRKEYDTNPSYSPHFFRKYDLGLTWQAERKDHEIVLLGTVVNRRSMYMRDLELTVRLLNDKGEILAMETVAEFPTFMPTGEGAPFHLNLRFPEGTAPARLRFGYTYWLTEQPPALKGYGGHEDIPHFGNLDAPL